MANQKIKVKGLSEKNCRTLAFEFDLIFVDGDNNLENLKVGEKNGRCGLWRKDLRKVCGR